MNAKFLAVKWQIDELRLDWWPPERELAVRDVIQPDSYVVDAGAALESVAATMAERHIGSALVTRDGQLVGIFTTTDACRALARVLRERQPDPGPVEVA